MSPRRAAAAKVDDNALVRAWMDEHSDVSAKVSVTYDGTAQFLVALYDLGELFNYGMKAEPFAVAMDPDLERAMLQAINEYETGEHARNGRDTQGLRAMASRIVAAEERFIEYAMTHGSLTRVQAERALAEYRKARVIKIDPIVGQFTFKHGAFGDREVLRRAAGLG